MTSSGPNGCALAAVMFAALLVSLVLAAWRWVVSEEQRCRL